MQPPHGALPVVAFVFTDIEGSSTKWLEHGEAMNRAVAAHDRLTRSLFEKHGALSVKCTGDGAFAVFGSPHAALAAVLALELELPAATAAAGVPLRVRCGVHAGEASRRDDDWFGPEVNRAARIMGLAHGGQVLVSDAIVALARSGLPARAELRDAGTARLQGYPEPARVAQLVHPDLPDDFPPLDPDAEPLPALPLRQRPAIGRGEEIAAVIAAMAASPIVTIVGPGGIGKTVLAQAVAFRQREHFPGGVAWVDISALNDAALVPTAVAAAFGTELPANDDALAALVALLGRRRRSTLVVLDNAEHVADAVAALAAGIVASAPQVALLVTSQVPLHVEGETLHRLGPLALPPAATTPDDALGYGAVELFVARVRSIDARFALTAATLPTVLDLCRHLDGLPLALELAAARVPALGLAAVNRLLGERFRLLTTRQRGVPDRQHTLHATLDWSHQLLTPEQQSVFRRLGAFVGEFGLDDAGQVAADDALDAWAVTEIVTELVDRSLVGVRPDDEARYRLSESARAYALERLRDAGETSPLDRAARLYEAQGDRDAADSRNAAAATAYASAREATLALPPSAERDAREIALDLKLGPALQTALGPANPRCDEVYRRAVGLARRSGDPRALLTSLWGHWHSLYVAGRDREARAALPEMLELGSRVADDGLELEAHHAALTTEQVLGNAEAVVVSAQRVSQLYEPARHHSLSLAFGGHDPGVCALAQGSIGLWLTGYPDQALEMSDRAVTLGARIDHAYSYAIGLYFAAMTRACAGRVDALTTTAGTLERIVERYDIEALAPEARFFTAQAAFEQSPQPSAVAAMREALDAKLAAGDRAFAFYFMATLAEAFVATARPAEALAVLEGVEAIADGGQAFLLPEPYRVRALALAAHGDQAAAQRSLAFAADCAQRQRARSLMLRVAIARHRLADSPEGRAGAIEAVRAALGSFDEGHATRDLATAHRLLAGGAGLRA